MALNEHNPDQLNAAFQQFEVIPPKQWGKDGPPADAPVGWYAVANDEEILAYFQYPNHAYAFRLALVSELLNPLLHH